VAVASGRWLCGKRLPGELLLVIIAIVDAVAKLTVNVINWLTAA
jgi:hypothetical protein